MTSANMNKPPTKDSAPLGEFRKRLSRAMAAWTRHGAETTAELKQVEQGLVELRTKQSDLEPDRRAMDRSVRSMAAMFGFRVRSAADRGQKKEPGPEGPSA